MGRGVTCSHILCNFANEFTCDKPHYENEVPFEVPSSWEWCKLGEVCVFLSRGKSPKYLDEDRQYPVFAQKCNLKEGGISLAQARFLDPMTINKWDEVYKLRTGDVLVNSTGTGTVGRTRLFNESCLGDYPFVVPDSHVSVVRTADEIVSEYIYAYISSNVVQEYLEDNLAGSTNQKELYIGILDSLQIPLPPYVEQKRIVSEIEKWYKASEAIENGKSDLEKVIKQTKNKILDLAIHGKLVPQDPTDEPASELLKRINPIIGIACDNAQYGKLPNGWCETLLGNIGTWQSGATPSRLRKDYYGGSIPWLKTGDLNDGIVQFIPESITERALEETSVKLNPADSILIAMYGATIGKIGILSKPATTNQACCACVDYLAEKMFLFYFLLANREQFIAMGGGGAQPNISKEKIIHTHIPFPPLQEQHRIVAKIEELFAQLNRIASSL